MDFNCKNCGGTKSIDLERNEINYKACISCDTRVIWREKFKIGAKQLTSREPIARLIAESRKNLEDLEFYIQKLKHSLADSWVLLERAGNQDSDSNLMKEDFKEQANKIEKLLCLDCPE